MKALDRVLVEKAGRDLGWERILLSGPEEVRLASARHDALGVVTEKGEGYRLELPSPLVGELAARRFSAPGDALFVPDLEGHRGLLRQGAELARSLPDLPRRRYQEGLERTLAGLESTEVRRLVAQRVGQDLFREALLDYWGGACAVTGLDLPELLFASHAKPWAEASDEERLDVYNGFLLRADLDALFDRGLVTFDLRGELVSSPVLCPRHREALGLEGLRLRRISPFHGPYLAWHRCRVFRVQEPQG